MLISKKCSNFAAHLNLDMDFEKQNTPWSDINIDKFLASDKIQGCEEGLWTYYEPANETYYHLVHNPTIAVDQIPKSLRRYENLAAEEIDIDQELLSEMLTLKTQKDLLNDFGLSGNVSCDQLKIKMLKIAKKYKGKDLDEWIKSMGDCIAKYNLLPEVGYIEKKADKTGHKNLHLYKEVNMEAYRDQEFGYIPLFENNE